MFDAVEYTPIATATKTIHQIQSGVGVAGHAGAALWFDKPVTSAFSGIQTGQQRKRDVRKLLLIT